MPAFEILLNRYCTRSRIDLEDAIEVKQFAETPPIERGWKGWLAAERALRSGDPRLALNWLGRCRGLADEGGPALAAELALTEARSWMALDEPREAAAPVNEAQRLW